MIGLLPALLRNDTHRQNGYDDRKDYAAEAEDKLKIADGGLDIVEHSADAHEHQQERTEKIGGQRVEIGPQFVLQNGNHCSASSLSPHPASVPASDAGAPCRALSVSSRKMSSRFAFFKVISSRAFFCSANAKNTARDTS